MAEQPKIQEPIKFESKVLEGDPASELIKHVMHLTELENDVLDEMKILQNSLINKHGSLLKYQKVKNELFINVLQLLGGKNG